MNPTFDYTALPKECIYLPKRLTDAQTNDLVGTMLPASAVLDVIASNVDVFCQDTGDCLLKFRKAVLSMRMVNKAYGCLYHAATESDNRGMASGKIQTLEEAKRLAATRGWILDEEAFVPGMPRLPLITLKGRKSSRSRALPIRSGIVGFMAADSTFPYCRMTAYTQSHFSEFAAAYPIIKEVDTVYAQLMPEPYARQREEANRSSPDFVIRDTAFTTITVNRNWQTACHTDKGDFVGGFGNLTVLRKGKYSGGLFVLPQYGVGIDMQNQDVLLADVHRVHGNTPIVRSSADATRISLVMYYREGIERCGTNAEELKKARKIVSKRHK